MNEAMLQKARSVLAERRRAITEAENPQAEAIAHLQKGGYLDEAGEVAERFRGGLEAAKRQEAGTEMKSTESQQSKLAF